MKMRSTSFPIVFLLCVLTSSRSGFALSDNFSGLDLRNDQRVEVRPGAKGTVAIFMSAKCPCSNSHVKLVQDLAREFKEFAFVLVHANADEAVSSARTYFRALDFTFPVLQDERTELANRWRANKTPHAFVIAPGGTVLYKGGVTASNRAEPSSQQFLRNALEDVTHGVVVRVSEGRTVGCVISR